MQDHEAQDPESAQPHKEYIGYVWKGQGPRVPVRLWARDSKEAMVKVEADHPGYKYSIWNEEDASKPR